MLSVARWNLIRPRDWLRRGFPASPLDVELGILLMPSGNRFQRRRIAGGSFNWTLSLPSIPRSMAFP